MLFFGSWKDGLQIYLFWGRKGQGKSYVQYRLFETLTKEYYKTEKKYPELPHRKYYSSQKFSEEVEKRELGKHLAYWRHPEELYSIRNADIGWDEIGKDIPAGSWTDTPKELKQVFSHLRKRGNRLFANTQVFEDIDIAFRRQIDHAYLIEKTWGSRDISITLPPIRRIYGIVRKTEFDPQHLEFERNPEYREELKPSFFQILHFSNYMFIKRKWIDLYDTKMELPAYRARGLKEWILECVEGQNCQQKDKFGNPHRKIFHEPV